MDIFEKLKAYDQARKPSPTGPVEYLVVGLGNPGKNYEGTRHNAGFMAIDAIADRLDVKVDKVKFKGLCGDAFLGGKRILLLKPSTFMNLSGQSVTEAAAFHKIPMEHVILLYDDISLDVGRVRLRRKGSDGGHNGIKNIIYLSGKDTFPRVKIGVGKKPHPDFDLADWVLSRFTPDERQKLNEAVYPFITDMVRMIIEGNIDQAMNLYNR